MELRAAKCPPYAVLTNSPVGDWVGTWEQYITDPSKPTPSFPSFPATPVDWVTQVPTSKPCRGSACTTPNWFGRHGIHGVTRSRSKMLRDRPCNTDRRSRCQLLTSSLLQHEVTPLLPCFSCRLGPRSLPVDRRVCRSQPNLYSCAFGILQEQRQAPKGLSVLSSLPDKRLCRIASPVFCSWQPPCYYPSTNRQY